MPPKRRKSGTPQPGGAPLLLIGVFKVVKGLALLAVGFGLHRLLHRDVAHVVYHWVQLLRVDPDNVYVHKAIASVINVSPRQLKELSAGTFLYAALTLTEGTGLLLRKRWAEYFTVITTGLFVPLELYELSRHVTPAKVAVLAINLAILVYLIYGLRRRK